MRIVSWNVNGLRACAKKGFLQVLQRKKIDVMALQEVRAYPEQLPDKVRSPRDWLGYFAPATRPGYSGVAIYSRIKPTRVECGLGESRFDEEGRFLLAQFSRMSIASVYFPTGSGKDRDNSRVPYKMDFYRAVFDRIQHQRKLGPVFVTGDFNTAHHVIDIARPKSNLKASGFLPEERQELTRWEDAGWVDTFRHRHPEEAGHYTWWRQFGGARQHNVGWRIDYVFASKTANHRVKNAFIWRKTMGSDHCPVGVDLI